MKTEILAPAGGEQAAIAALTSGADAVYLGIKQFSAREGAENFDMGSLMRTVRLAHVLGAKVYAALNTLIKDSELEAFFETARLVWNAGVDAILVQDLFLGRELLRRWPAMKLHLSTQAGCCNLSGALVAKEYGFSRVVLARETPIADMAAISAVIETEAFVQGALCTAFSGQCYFSSFAGNHSGNRGRCKQPCRKKYRIDRKGYEEEAYALSVSDLSLGGRVRELLAAGVTSLKIEGRMRRPEYVGAAVKYYRALLDGTPSSEAFTALMRAYNRGDYTEGLGFGQGKDFLSRKVQGHIGEPVGKVSFVHGRPVCRSDYPAARGDAFKILRGGREAGGATFAERTEGGFLLSANFRLCAGDEVRLTTCVSSNGFALRPVKKKLAVSLRFLAGSPPRAESCGHVLTGEAPLDAAKSAPLTAEDLAACFRKTDDLPFEADISVQTDGVFMPRSALNAFRRTFYEGVAAALCPAREQLPPVCGKLPVLRRGKGDLLTAIIGERGDGADIFIYKPQSYAGLSRPRGERVYLYLPPFFTAADEDMLAPSFKLFDGLYCEGYYGVALAKKYGMKLFAGVGFNVTNSYAAAGAGAESAYFVLSKEISEREQGALNAENSFVLAGGAVKLMDLCYCPFERTCGDCDRKKQYRLTDEDGRVFPLRRYRISDMVCRFEVYNCAELEESTPPSSRLFDYSVRTSGRTKGHRERSML